MTRFEWSPEAIALAEDTSLTGREVARRLGVSEGVISTYRRGEGINTKGAHFKWTTEKERPLYNTTKSNREVADLLGCTLAQAYHRRGVLGIWDYPGPMQQFKISWPEGIEERLGTVIDRVIADEVGCSIGAVFLLRRKKGIEACGGEKIELPEGVSRESPKGKCIRRAHRRYWRLGEVNTLNWEQWEFALEWFDDRCAYCGAEEFLTEDHLIAVSKGGSRTALNMIPCCSSCNSSKCASKAQNWIYLKFGREKGQEIIERIVAYLTEVQALWGENAP